MAILALMAIMTIYIDATELKKNISSVLNSVYFGGNTAVVKKHGKMIVKITSLKGEGADINQSSSEKYFGALPDFPDLSSKRNFRKRKILL